MTIFKIRGSSIETCETPDVIFLHVPNETVFDVTYLFSVFKAIFPKF